MNKEALEAILRQGESLTAEFKSDRRAFSDREIYEEVVALANTQGGVLFIGVEDDSKVTGARPRHGNSTDPFRLQAAIFNNTVPSINTRVFVVDCLEGQVISIAVDPYPEPCATASGKALHRTHTADGKPQSVPFYPRDQRSRRIDLGLLDFSAQTLDTASLSDLDPLEFERLRQTIRRLHGDESLIHLADPELAKALRLVETQGERLVPTVAGMLLAGRESALREFLPTHEVHFQVIDAAGDVKVNETFRGPLIRVVEEVEARFSARNSEQEVDVGLFRVPVPDYSRQGFREALLNAVLHRDFSRLGAVYVQWQADHLLITNPGGFPEGINLGNLLVHEPKPRNPRLVEGFKRIGLVEQTGRGIDKIFIGQLRYGRPAPDYRRSDAEGVRVVLRGGPAWLDFAAFVVERDKQGRPLFLDDLLVLNSLFHERSMDSQMAGQLIQKGVAEGRSVLERLHEQGLIEARGTKRGKSYHLAAVVYRRLHMRAEYVRAKGFEPYQQEQMVLDYVQKHGRITRAEAAELCHLEGKQATRLLGRLTAKHPEFIKKGERRGAHYLWSEKEK